MEMFRTLTARPTVTVTVTAFHCGPTAVATPFPPTAPNANEHFVRCTPLKKDNMRAYTKHLCTFTGSSYF